MKTLLESIFLTKQSYIPLQNNLARLLKMLLVGSTIGSDGHDMT
jgi:hypothetical protein